MISISGLTSRAQTMHFSTSKLRYGSKSTLLSNISEAAANICGYFSGLSSPSVTESTATLCFSPRSKLAGQTRLPTFSINRIPLSSSGRRGVGNHLCVKMAAFTGVHLNRWCAGSANACGIVHGLLVAFNNCARNAVFQAH